MTYQTFEEIAPTWFARIHRGPQSDVELRQWINEMGQFKMCVYGEAFKFRNITPEEEKRLDVNYAPRCEKCYDLGQEISKTYSTYRAGIMTPINEFIEHYNTRHQDQAAVKATK